MIAAAVVTLPVPCGVNGVKFFVLKCSNATMMKNVSTASLTATITRLVRVRVRTPGQREGRGEGPGGERWGRALGRGGHEVRDGGGAGLARAFADDDEDARPDDRADAHRGELDRADRPFELVSGLFGL